MHYLLNKKIQVSKTTLINLNSIEKRVLNFYTELKVSLGIYILIFQRELYFRTSQNKIERLKTLSPKFW